jgi:hypothetical protein
MLDRPLCERIPVLQHSRFYSCSSVSDNLKAVRGINVSQFCLAMCLQNLWLNKVKKLGTFGYAVGVSLPRNFKLMAENFKLVRQIW